MTRERMAQIFNEWVRRYAADPTEFGNILDDAGNPVKDYGESCSLYFEKLNRELATTEPPLPPLPSKQPDPVE